MTNADSPGEMERFFDDIEELLRRGSNLGDEEIARLRGRVESSIGKMRSTATEGMDTAMRGARVVAEGADDYVRGNPWVAIGIAAAAGLLIGSLLNRK
jgi:ElaB/YqjD/DUF883 family membrane-anchored ribosome-binding protein